MRNYKTCAKYIIYALHHPDSSRVYVGKSSKGLYRPVEHGQEYNLNHTANYPISRWIRSLRKQGKDFEIAVLEEFQTPASLDEAECFHIAYFKSLGILLLNCTAGGGGMLNPTPETRANMVAAKQNVSAETRAKISEKASNRSEITRARLSASLSGRPLALECRRKLSISHTGLKRTPEECERIGSVHRGKPKSPEQVAKMVVSRRNRKEFPAWVTPAVLRAWRLELVLTLNDAATVLGISRNTLAFYERKASRK